jgi:hypothetical protein
MMIRKQANRQDTERWCETHEVWRESHHLRWRCQSEWGAKRYLRGRGSREGKGLKLVFRCESAALRGNSTKVEGTLEECTCGKIEDETHILIDCPVLSIFREELFKKVEEILQNERWEEWLEEKKEETAAILLGARWRLSPSQEDRVDLATQIFLCQAERLRVKSLGLPSFRSRVGQGAKDGPGDPTAEEMSLLCEELDEVIDGYLREERED